MTHRIVMLDDEGIGPTVKLPPLPFPHSWSSYSYTSPEEVVDRLRDATVALTCSVPMRKEQLEQLPDLQMISLALTGTDIVDIDYCSARGIQVTNVPGYAENTVAEHVIAMIFDLLRRAPHYHQLMRDLHRKVVEPKNIYFDFRIRDVAGKTLGIVGSGPIARRLAELARALNMEVYFHDRGGKLKGDDYIPLDQLLRRSDVLSLNCPLTAETRNLIGADELALMKRDAILVNTARGGIVNEAALIAALQADRLGGAALDVLEHEPVRPDNSIFQLIDRNDFILNPHVAWSSEDALQSLLDQAVDNIVRFVTGAELTNAVTDPCCRG